MSARIRATSASEVLAIAQRAHAASARLDGEPAYPFAHRWERSRYPIAWLCTHPKEAP